MRSTNLNFRLSYFPAARSSDAPSLPCARTVPVIVPAWQSKSAAPLIQRTNSVFMLKAKGNLSRDDVLMPSLRAPEFLALIERVLCLQQKVRAESVAHP